MEEALLKEIVSLLSAIRTGVVVVEVVACLMFGVLLGKVFFGK